MVDGGGEARGGGRGVRGRGRGWGRWGRARVGGGGDEQKQQYSPSINHVISFLTVPTSLQTINKSIKR